MNVDLTSAHRQFAVEYFNQAWGLIDKDDRSSAEDLRMLLLTCASRLHWEVIGTDSNRAIGDWQIAHVLSRLGDGTLALRFAEAGLAVVNANGWTDFHLASAYEGMARAHATLGNRAERDRYLDLARAALAGLDEEDRKIIEGQVATVPDC